MRAVAAVLAIAAIGWAAATAAAAPRAQCAPTPNFGGGPDRGPIALRAKIGTGHVLTGVVLSPTCTPIPGATVSFWPVAYDGRPGHIHIKVQARDYETLYTEYEPHGAPTGTVRLVLVPAAL
jgi:protocatechuate 3,4-dioxygenase beta subunit